MTFLAFKGGHSYELQIGRLVLQVRHTRNWHGFKPRLVNAFIA